MPTSRRSPFCRSSCFCGLLPPGCEGKIGQPSFHSFAPLLVFCEKKERPSLPESVLRNRPLNRGKKQIASFACPFSFSELRANKSGKNKTGNAFQSKARSKSTEHSDWDRFYTHTSIHINSILIKNSYTILSS